MVERRRQCRNMVGRSDEEARLSAELFETLSVIDAACEYFLTHNWERPVTVDEDAVLGVVRENRLLEIAHSCGFIRSTETNSTLSNTSPCGNCGKCVSGLSL